MSDSIDAAVEEVVHDAVEESVPEVIEEVNEGGPTVVVVDNGGSKTEEAAEALNLANEVKEIAQEEAVGAATDAAVATLAVVEQQFLTKEEAVSLVHDAVTAAVAATVATSQQPTIEEAADELPVPGSNHAWYRKRFKLFGDA